MYMLKHTCIEDRFICVFVCIVCMPVYKYIYFVSEKCYVSHLQPTPVQGSQIHFPDIYIYI